jgi:hypothetical protein
MQDFCENMGLEAKSSESWTEWKTDKAVVVCFRAKGELGQVLSNFEVNHDIDGDSSMNRVKEELKTGQKVKVSADYLKYLLKLITKQKGSSVTISIKNDYPAMFSMDNFELIIAPRIEY